MEEQTLQSLDQTQTGIPKEWEERFLIKRIDEDNIEISLLERDEILKALNRGDRFIQVGKYTLMINAIKSIDPKNGSNNIPPRPEKSYYLVDGIATETEESKKIIALWDSLYKDKIVKQ